MMIFKTKVIYCFSLHHLKSLHSKQILANLQVTLLEKNILLTIILRSIIITSRQKMWRIDSVFFFLLRRISFRNQYHPWQLARTII